MSDHSVVIVDAGGTNFASVQAALKRLHVSSLVTNDIKAIKKAHHVILPGVGAAGHAMRLLVEHKLSDVIRSLRQPVLGICLGQQLLCLSSEEDNTDCLGVIPIKVTKLKKANVIPHMGWNNLSNIQSAEPLLKDIDAGKDFYFAHSFAPNIHSKYTLAICQHGIDFSAVIKKDNFYGVQFHPEKSGEVGMQLLKNFIDLS